MEKSPLIQPGNAPPGYRVITASPIFDEAPQDIQVETKDGQNVSYIVCRACGRKKSLDGMLHCHIIRCPVCKEWTAIRPPPEGQRYIRCSCRILINCRRSATQITCPQVSCKRVIYIPMPDPHDPRNLRFMCAYCNQEIRMYGFQKFGRCGFCGHLSCMGHNYTFPSAMICFVIGMIIVGGTVAMAILTANMARHHWPIYAGWVVCAVAAFSIFVRGGLYLSIKTSHRLPPPLNTC